MGGFRIPTMSPGDETASAYLARRYAFPYGRTGIRGVGEEDPWQPVQTSPTMAEGMALNTPAQSPTNFGGRLLQGLGDLVAGGQVPSFTQSADPAYRAPFLASLLNSGLNAFGAVRRGQAERAAGQDALQQQDFKNRLQVALLNQKQAPSLEHVLLKNGNFGAWDPATGKITDTGMPANTTESRAGAGQYFTDDNGNVTWSPGGGQAAIPVPGARGKRTKETPAKEPTAQERLAASQLQGVDDAVARLEQIANENPAALDQATAAIKAEKVPVVGGALAAGRNLLMGDAAQEAYTLYHNYLLGVTPTYGGSRPTKPLLDLEESASLPGLAAGGEARAAAFRAMHARIADLRAKAGKAAPALPPAAPVPAPAAPVGPAAPASPNSAAGLTNRKAGTPPVDPAITQFYQPKVGP